MKKILSMAPLFIISGIMGFYGGMFMVNYLEQNNSFIDLVFLFVFFTITYLLQLILHEGGHLLFGLLTGYKFLSFRVGSLMIQKEEDKYVFKKLNLAGTAGQCILCAPEKGTPYILYNLGGIIVNLILGIISILLLQITTGLVSLFFLMNAFTAFLTFVTNGIPARVGGVSNDGMNTWMMYKDKNAVLGFYKQLIINEKQTKGIRLKDMDPELFEIEGDYHNELIATVLVFKENYLMDLHEFDKAKELLEYILSDQCSAIGLHESLLKNDLMYISILKKEDYTFDKNMIRFRKSMKDFPSVIRCEYAMELAKGNDGKKELDHFNKVIKTYPLKADIDCEKELIEVVKNVYL